MRPVKGPDGTVFHLTDPQRVAHLTQLSPAAEKPVPPSKRVHMEPARARSLGIPWDEATRTVAFDDYGPNAGARAAEALFEQRSKNNERAGTREDRADTASRIARAEDTLGKLKKSEEQYAESGAVRSRAQYDNAGRILLSPDASPKIKARFAQMLGVRGAMTKPETDAKGQPMGASVEIKDANGSPVYDPGDISAAIERKTKAAQAWHLNRIRQQNKAERAFQEDTQRRSGAILANDGMAPDEAPDPLDEYRALRASWGAAESDTAAGGIDQKAY